MDELTDAHAREAMLGDRLMTADTRIAELEDALTDAIGFINGDISGSAQRDAIVAEAVKLLGGNPWKGKRE
jgi:hypothetical protein